MLTSTADLHMIIRVTMTMAISDYTRAIELNPG